MDEIVKTTTETEAPLVTMDWRGETLLPLERFSIEIWSQKDPNKSSETNAYKYDWYVRLEDGQYIQNGGIYPASKNVYLLLEQILMRVSESLRKMEINEGGGGTG